MKVGKNRVWLVPFQLKLFLQNDDILVENQTINAFYVQQRRVCTFVIDVFEY
jgi:hypothetical protein